MCLATRNDISSHPPNDLRLSSSFHRRQKFNPEKVRKDLISEFNNTEKVLFHYRPEILCQGPSPVHRPMWEPTARIYTFAVLFGHFSPFLQKFRRSMMPRFCLSYFAIYQKPIKLPSQVASGPPSPGLGHSLRCPVVLPRALSFPKSLFELGR